MPKPVTPRSDRVTTGHDGVTDLATFGALPVALIGVPALADTGLTTATPAARMAFAPTAGDATDGHDSHAVATPSSGNVDHALTPTPLAGAITATVVALAPGTGAGDIHAVPTAGSPASSGIATFVPMPHGGGAVSDAAPVVTNSSHAVADDSAPVAAIPAGDSIESMRASVVALQVALDTLAGRLPPLPGADALDGTVAHLGDAVAGTLGGASATIDHIGDTASALITSATETLDHIVAGAPDAEAIASITDAALSDVAGLTFGVAAPTVNAIVAPVAATLDHIVASVPDLGSIVSPVSTTLGDVAHTAVSTTTPVLDHISGGDPVGGIATLVGMVSAADAFNLHDAGSDVGADFAPALGIAGSVDLLADVLPHEALLGIGDHHEDGIAGIDLHDGLFGHG